MWRAAILITTITKSDGFQWCKQGIRSRKISRSNGFSHYSASHTYMARFGAGIKVQQCASCTYPKAERSEICGDRGIHMEVERVPYIFIAHLRRRQIQRSPSMVEMLGICEHSGIMLIMIMCGRFRLDEETKKNVRMHVLWFFFSCSLYSPCCETNARLKVICFFVTRGWNATGFCLA